MEVFLHPSPNMRATPMSATFMAPTCGDITSLSFGIPPVKRAQHWLMKKRCGTLARLVAVAVLIWTNASFAVAGAVADTGRSADLGVFAGGYVICTPNGMITVAADDLGLAGGGADQPPAPVWAGPVCPDCILGSATAAPVSPCIAARVLTSASIQYSAHAVRPHSSAVLSAYDSRAPPF